MSTIESKDIKDNSTDINDIKVSTMKKLEYLVENQGLVLKKRSRGIRTYISKLSFKLNIIREKRQELFLRKPLLGYSIKRILFALVTLYVAMAVVYVMLTSVISDATLMQNIDMKTFAESGGIHGEKYKAALAGIKHTLGMDKSMLVQVLNWWLNMTFIIPVSYVKGEYVHKWFYLGTVLSNKIGNYGDGVWSTIKDAMPTSFKIGFTGFLVAYLVGIPLGILCAKFKNKGPDKIINITAIFLQAIPAIIIVALIYVLAISLWGATARYDSGGFSTKIYAFITMFILVLPQIVIDVRRYVVDEMTSDYAKFAKSKGMSESYIFTVHIFRVAGVRVLRIIPGALILSLFGSSILTETYWSVKGMSSLILLGVNTRDLCVCMGYITISAAFGIIASLVADLVTAMLDPRVSLIK